MIGRTVSHYLILEKLGEGGMAEVYKARDLKLDRFAALKFLPLQMVSNEELKNRFILEAKLTSSFDHPNICTIYEISKYSNSQLFISMAYYEGETLKHEIEKGIVKLQDAINYSIQIAQGLQKAHDKGIIHRDVKPANIIITNEGLVKILDFGIAKFFQSAEITKDHFIAGSTLYMSPEQIKGDDLDNRTDLFSFGLVLYEMLTGKHPFKGEYEQAVIYSILNEEPEPVNLINSQIPSGLSEIITRCLVKDKLYRINSFEEIIRELKLLLTTVESNKEKLIDRDIEIIKNYIPQKDKLFIGRESQVKILQEKIASIFQGKGKTVFICGEPGIGKTQLIFNTINNFFDPNIFILYGRCLFNEGGVPYHPFVSAIKNGIAVDDELFFSRISKIGASQNINLRNRIPIIKSFINLSDDYFNTLLHKEQLWDSVFMLFKIISMFKPLILILDDLQRADKATLDLISFIARNVENIPLLLIGVYRPYETSSDNESSVLTEIFRNLRIENLAEKIELKRLSEKETNEIIKQLFGSEKVDKKITQKIFRQSEGNPLFINELVSLLKDKGYINIRNGTYYLNTGGETESVSERVQDVIKQRIECLDNRSREILEVASCEGENFQSDVLSGCLNINRIELLKILQSLENENHIIRYDKNFYRFDHILIRDVLYESILPELREEYHRIISHWLIEKYGNKDEYASRIAYHLISAGEEKESIEYLLTAANKAKDLYALEEALHHYTRLLKIVKTNNTLNINKLQIEEGLGDVYSSLGKIEESIMHFKQFLELAEKENQDAAITKALRKLSESYRMTGDLSKAEQICNKAVDLAYKNDDKKEIAEALNTLAFINASKGDYKKAIDISKEVLKISDEIKDLKNKSICLSNLGFAYWHLGNYSNALEEFNNALSIQRSIGDSLGISTSLNYLGLVYLKLGNYELSLNSSLEGVEIKKQIAEYRTLPGCLNVAGDSSRDIGNIDKAIEYHEQSLLIARGQQNKGAMCDNLRDLGEDYLLKGDVKKSLDYYLEVLELAVFYGLKWYETRTCISLAEFYLFQDNERGAKEYLKRGLENSYDLNAKELIIEALWKDALIKAKENLPAESIKTFERAIEMAQTLNHRTFLWKLYLDFSRVLSSMNEIKRASDAITYSKTVAEDIIKGFSDGKLKTIYLNTPKIKDLFSIRF